jgi:hypothetical protein
MSNRARIRTLLRRAGLSAAVIALVPAAAGTAQAAKKPSPVITSVSPMTAAIGKTMTIKGRHFRRGVGKNTVAFKRSGARVVFVKAGISTAKMLKVKLPAKLAPALRRDAGVSIGTQFKLRVISSRMGKSFTSRRLSPTITPQGSGDAAPLADCDRDGVVNRVDTDDDSDLLLDTLEDDVKLDSCNPDSDGDGVADGFEYRSARDLNDDDYQQAVNEYLPFPGTRPYPNALDATDANSDFDGDSLTLREEYDLWNYTIRRGAARPANLDDLAQPLTYSDGEQYSLMTRDANGYRVPSMSVAAYPAHQQFVDMLVARRYRSVTFKVRPITQWNDTTIAPVSTTFGIFDVNLDGETPAEVAGNADLDGDGWISDDERDEDVDGLSNYDESHGRMLPSFWTDCYEEETPYKIAYAGTDMDDADSDGDGLLDGADDQDHDDVPNVMELSRFDASGLFDGPRGCKVPKPPVGQEKPYQVHNNVYGRVNPFNPCMPLVWSRTCERHRAISGSSAPFDDSTNWYSLN